MGLLDPLLVNKFLHIVKTSPEVLQVGQNYKNDPSGRIFNAIVATGALDWDRKQGMS